MNTPAVARRIGGFSLIELMIAMVLGLVVAAGIISIFVSTNSSNRVQSQLSRLQEEGRFAITRITDDLALANGSYCSNSGGNAHLGTGGVYIDGLRAPTVYAGGESIMKAMSDLTTDWGAATSASGTYPSAPTSPFSLPAFLAMRGYDCTIGSTCTPIDPHSLVSSIPAAGTSVGARVEGTAILTMRYIDPSSGWAVYPAGTSTSAGSGSTLATATSSGTVSQINLNPASNEPAVSHFKSGDVAMLANCSSAQIFAVTGGGTSTLTPAAAASSAGTGQNMALPSTQQGSAAPMLFDVNRDYLTVTYFLQVVQNADGTTKTGALMRRVNGASLDGKSTADEIVRGIERLDFKYGVEYPDGTTRFLTAAQVDKSNATTPGCTTSVPLPIDTINQGCLWRAVKSIEVDLLMDGQMPLYTLSQNEMQYTYLTDGITAPASPSSSGRLVTPTQQGFVNQLLRREFTAVVSLRNYNP